MDGRKALRRRQRLIAWPDLPAIAAARVTRTIPIVFVNASWPVEQGLIEGPPYHCDINAMRALFPAQRWQWPRPPYAQVAHPNLMHELAVPLQRLAG